MLAKKLVERPGSRGCNSRGRNRAVIPTLTAIGNPDKEEKEEEAEERDPGFHYFFPIFWLTRLAP